MMRFREKTGKEDTTYLPKIDVHFFVAILILLLAAIKQLYGIKQYLDITFFDETEYLQKGVGLASKVYNDWGPSYNLWYFFVSKFTDNNIDTYFLNVAILLTVTPILLYVFLVFHRVQTKWALLFSLSFLMQELLLNNFTYVSHFCLCIILIGFIFIAITKKNEHKIIIAITTAYICMYARQEFLLIAVALFVLYLIQLAYQKKLQFHISYAFLLFVIIILYRIFGPLSMQAEGMDRSYFAFMQHFVKNYMFWNRKYYTLDELRALNLFDDSKTMFQCMFANPFLFIKHILTNIANYCINIFFYVESFLLPKPIFHYLGKVKHIVFIGIIAILAYNFFKEKQLQKTKQFIQTHTMLFLIYSIFLSLSFFSIVFIYPNRHYVILQFFWLILFLGFLLKDKAKFLDNAYVFYGIILAILFFVPTSKYVSFFSTSNKDARNQPNLKTINYLTKNNTHQPQILFTTENGFETYLPKNYSALFMNTDDLKPYLTNGDFKLNDFIKDKKIDIFYMNEKLTFYVDYAKVKETELLLHHPDSLGFRKQLLDTSTQAYLLIKK
ncbi:MAG: hypothetical protein U0U67_03515 [Chitinophagales bacterium]